MIKKLIIGLCGAMSLGIGIRILYELLTHRYFCIENTPVNIYFDCLGLIVLGFLTIILMMDISKKQIDLTNCIILN